MPFFGLGYFDTHLGYFDTHQNAESLAALREKPFSNYAVEAIE